MSLYKGETVIAGVPTGLIDTVNNKADTTYVDTELDKKANINSDVIDGQWVGAFLDITTSASAGTYTIDLSSYLPNDDYNYEVLINGSAWASSSTMYSFISSSIIPQSTSYFMYHGSNGTRTSNAITLPVGTDRTITYVINGGSNSLVLNALGYRRIGTNE